MTEAANLSPLSLSGLPVMPPLDSPQQARRGERPQVLMVKYVDDTTTVERLDPDAAVRHISSARPTEAVPAPATTGTLCKIIRRAREIGMIVNCRKTQLLCISNDNGYSTSSSISIQGDNIVSAPTMKLLGFMLSSSGDMSAQVFYLKSKFCTKFWTIIHLRRAGIKGLQLYKLYAALVRPVLETNCVIFHPMMTATQSEELERLQKLAFRVCFGFHLSYRAALEMWNLSTLANRRNQMLEKFVAKAMSNRKFADRWFVTRPDVNQELRNRRPYEEKKVRTARYYRSPLLTCQRIANNIATRT